MPSDGTAYLSEDDRYGAMLSNLLNPPDEGGQQAQQAAPDPRMAVPSGEPPNPVLKTRNPQVAQAAPTVPASVTPNGAATGAPKTWADYVRAGLDRGITASDQSQTALTGIQNQPTAESTNAPLEARRSALSQPLNPNDPEYKPGIGTRIVRGIDAVRRGGVLGAVDPADVGGTRYGAPNTQYQIDTQRRAQQVGSLDQQMKENIDTQKADTDRLGKIATDQRAQATTALDIGKTASAQETAEHNDQLAQVRQQLADQGGTPKTYEQAVIASNDPNLPAPKRAQYAAAAKTIAATEIKKFQYAAKANGDPYDDKRQSMIDDATQKVKDLQDKFTYNSDDNTYSDPNDASAKSYTPQQYTDMKNSISTKLDASLSKAKLRTLRVRFDPKDAGAGKGAGQAASPAQTAPKSVTDVQQGQVYNGYKYLGGNKADQKSWQKQ